MERQDKDEGLVKKLQRATSDTLALTALNTIPLFCIETELASMSAYDSANARLITPFTHPIYGIIRDYAKNPNSKLGKIINPAKKKHEKNILKIEKKKNIFIDIGVGLGIGAIEVAVGLAKYYSIRLLYGQNFDLADLRASFFVAAYTAFAGDIIGITIDTHRDGLGIEKKENSRSLFPEKMNSTAKKTITYVLSTATLVGLEELYRRTR